MKRIMEHVIESRGMRLVVPTGMTRVQAAHHLAELAGELLSEPGGGDGPWTEDMRLQAGAAVRTLSFAAEVTGALQAQLEAPPEPEVVDETRAPLRKVTWRRNGVKHERLECGHKVPVAGYAYTRAGRRRCDQCLAAAP